MTESTISSKPRYPFDKDVVCRKVRKVRALYTPKVSTVPDTPVATSSSQKQKSSTFPKPPVTRLIEQNHHKKLSRNNAIAIKEKQKNPEAKSDTNDNKTLTTSGGSYQNGPHSARVVELQDNIGLGEDNTITGDYRNERVKNSACERSLPISTLTIAKTIADTPNITCTDQSSFTAVTTAVDYDVVNPTTHPVTITSVESAITTTPLIMRHENESLNDNENPGDAVVDTVVDPTAHPVTITSVESVITTTRPIMRHENESLNGNENPGDAVVDTVVNPTAHPVTITPVESAITTTLPIMRHENESLNGNGNPWDAVVDTVVNPTAHPVTTNSAESDITTTLLIMGHENENLKDNENPGDAVVDTDANTMNTIDAGATAVATEVAEKNKNITIGEESTSSSNRSIPPTTTQKTITANKHTDAHEDTLTTSSAGLGSNVKGTIRHFKGIPTHMEDSTTTTTNSPNKNTASFTGFTSSSTELTLCSTRSALPPITYSKMRQEALLTTEATVEELAAPQAVPPSTRKIKQPKKRLTGKNTVCCPLPGQANGLFGGVTQPFVPQPGEGFQTAMNMDFAISNASMVNTVSTRTFAEGVTATFTNTF